MPLLWFMKIVIVKKCKDILEVLHWKDTVTVSCCFPSNNPLMWQRSFAGGDGYNCLRENILCWFLFFFMLVDLGEEHSWLLLFNGATFCSLITCILCDSGFRICCSSICRRPNKFVLWFLWDLNEDALICLDGSGEYYCHIFSIAPDNLTEALKE